MKKKHIISPSILSADISNLGKEILEIECLDIDWHHIDVMDGHFVPNLTFGLPLIKKLKTICNKPLDVHLMISNPQDHIKAYLEHGADLLTFHWEATHHHHRLIDEIKQYGAKAGIALNPSTPVDFLEPILADLDIVLLMSVNPGYSGQKYLKLVEDKIIKLDHLISQKKLDHPPFIAVDGGVSKDNIAHLANLGARCFVAGSQVYGAKDRKIAVEDLRKQLS